MCYHKILTANTKKLEKYYDANARDIVYPGVHYENGYDFKETPIVTLERPKELLMCRWGFVPWFEKDISKVKAPITTLNCISEEMFEKPSFRDSAKQNKRCLIPATGFIEWHWPKLDKPKFKTPYKVFAKEQEIFSIGGLTSDWRDRTTGTEVFSYVVLTTASTGGMTWLHNSKKRQPVIIPRKYEKDWLNANLSEADVLALCKSMPEDFLDYYPIDRKYSGNKLTSDEKNSPEIEKRVDYPAEEIDEVEVPKTVRESKPRKSKGDQSQQSLF
jgi:putative SOS response-associated peptidase YedK